MAELLFRRTGLGGFALSALRTAASAGIVTLFDAVIDPIAVNERRWVWEEPGTYHGVPAGNFAGWFATAAAIFMPLQASYYRIPPRIDVPPWIWFMPAFGHCLFLLLCAKVCMERGLRAAGAVGLTASALLTIAGILSLFR